MRGRPGRSRAAAVLLVALVAPVLWTWGFVLAMHLRARTYLHHTRRAGEPPPAVRQLSVWATEVLALLAVQASQLLAPVAHRTWRPATPHGRPVLCVHGFTQNGSNFTWLRRRLYARGRPTEAVLLGIPPRRIEAYADVLEQHLERMIDTSRLPVDVVAHSMGGVVLRVVLVRRPDLRGRLGQVVTVGSPHRGTGAARGLPLPETRFMGRRSDALLALPMLSELVDPRTLTTVGGDEDTTVYPVETTLDPGARQVVLPGLGHAGILWHASALDTVVRALEAPIPASPTQEVTFEVAPETA